jgi:hypothetical protein
MIQRILIAAIAAGVVACSSAGTSSSTASAPLSSGTAPGLGVITEADIRRDIFALGGDAMRGREAGTIDEMRATGWVAERAREAGLQPAGDDGTYFQWWPMRRTRLSANSQISVGGKSLQLWKDVVMLNNQFVNADLPIVFVSDTSAIATTNLRGRAAALVLPPITTQPIDQFTIRGNFQGAIANMARARAAQLAQAGAAAVILLTNGSPNVELAFTATAAVSSRGSYGLDTAGAPAAGAGGRGGRGNAAPAVPTVWVRGDMLDAVRAPNARLTALVFSETFQYPSGNVIGLVKGTDPRLANEYVLFSGHQDHDGARYSINGDSIWNGADDNATVSVAMLAAARAFAKHPAPRPVLFVWHGAEERGLLGSRWFVRQPTVPLSQIVAVLNGDMIGRNHPDSAALLGAQPPHKNSNALVAAALRANDEVTRFKLDTIWDRPTHNEGWYFRSDHLPYARANIPAIMFSTLLHADYHTPRDGPDRIDVAKLTKMSQWMYATAWIVATAAARPDVIPVFRLER